MRTVHNLAEVASKRKNLRNNLTPQEIMLWTRMKGKALGFKFRRQHSIGTYIVDFCCPSARLIIELDGSQHAEEKAEIYDETRTDYLRKLGYTILRFWNNEINANLESVLIHIEEYQPYLYLELPDDIDWRNQPGLVAVLRSRLKEVAGYCAPVSADFMVMKKLYHLCMISPQISTAD